MKTTITMKTAVRTSLKLLTEAKSEVLEKQLKIDSLKRKHLYMEKEVTRLLEEQRITSKKEMKMTEQFSLQLEYARSAARKKTKRLMN